MVLMIIWVGSSAKSRWDKLTRRVLGELQFHSLLYSFPPLYDVRQLMTEENVSEHLFKIRLDFMQDLLKHSFDSSLPIKHMVTDIWKMTGNTVFNSFVTQF